MPKIKIGGIMKHSHLAKVGVLSMPSRPGTAAAILEALSSARINVQFIVQCLDEKNQDHVVFCIDQGDLEATEEIIHKVKEVVEAQKVTHIYAVATIGIFGPDFRERPGIAGTMFRALANQGINILAISTSISTVSCLIEAQHLDTAETALHEAFDSP